VLDDPAPGVEDLRRMAARVGRRLWRGGRAAVWALPAGPARARDAGAARVPLGTEHPLRLQGQRVPEPVREGYARTVMNHGVVLRSAGYLPRAARGCPVLGVEAAARSASSSAATAPRSSTTR
jgi:hypothetical protein